MKLSDPAFLTKNLSHRLLGAALIAAGAVGAFAAAGSAHANTTLGTFSVANFNAGDSSNLLSAKVTFTYLSGATNGNLEVTIENLSTPLSDAELIRNVEFAVSGGGSPLSAAVTPYLPSGATELNFTGPSHPAQNGTTSIAAGGSLTNPWDVQASGTSSSPWDLTSDPTSKPSDFVGPDTAADLNSANASVATHQPVLLGPVSFEFNVAGLAGSSTISNVMVGYGTSSGITSASPVSVVTPEPAVLSFMAMGLAGALLMRKRKA